MNRLAAVGANRYRAFSLIGFLLLIQLVFAILFGSSQDWIADIAGFAAGFQGAGPQRCPRRKPAFISDSRKAPKSRAKAK